MKLLMVALVMILNIMKALVMFLTTVLTPGIPLAVVLGESEIAKGVVKVGFERSQIPVIVPDTRFLVTYLTFHSCSVANIPVFIRVFQLNYPYLHVFKVKTCNFRFGVKIHFLKRNIDMVGNINCCQVFLFYQSQGCISLIISASSC